MSAAIDLRIFDINTATLTKSILVGVLQLETETITVRELISQRVTQEVKEFNQELKDLPYALVQPNPKEKRLNGDKVRKLRTIELEPQITKALAAFESNGFFLLLNDKQLDDLETEIQVTDNMEVSFFRLVPLVGG